MKKITCLAFLSVASLGLSSCTGAMLGDYRTTTDYNLADSSYGAADMMIQQSRNVITNDTTIYVGALREVNNENEISQFGRVVANQIASRFVQLGYNVVNTAQDNAMLGIHASVTDENMPASLSNNAATMQAQPPLPQEDAIITGRYAVAKRDVIVNLQLIERGNGKVLASYDYLVPYNSNIRALTMTDEDNRGFF